VTTDVGRMPLDPIGRLDLFERVARVPGLPAARLARASAKTASDPRLLLQPVARRRLRAVRTVQVQLSPKLGHLGPTGGVLGPQRLVLAPQRVVFPLERVVLAPKPSNFATQLRDVAHERVDRVPNRRGRRFSASRVKGSYPKDKYHRLEARRGALRAALAIAHKILVSAYHMLAKNLPYRDRGEASLDRIGQTRTVANLKCRLERRGYRVIPDTVAISVESCSKRGYDGIPSVKRESRRKRTARSGKPQRFEAAGAASEKLLSRSW